MTKDPDKTSAENLEMAAGVIRSFQEVPDYWVRLGYLHFGRWVHHIGWVEARAEGPQLVVTVEDQVNKQYPGLNHKAMFEVRFTELVNVKGWETISDLEKLKSESRAKSDRYLLSHAILGVGEHVKPIRHRNESFKRNE